MRVFLYVIISALFTSASVCAVDMFAHREVERALFTLLLGLHTEIAVLVAVLVYYKERDLMKGGE